MNKPTQKEIKEVFDSIVINGLDFLSSSAEFLEENLKFSTVHFSIGLELILKAKIYHEHWTLVAQDPHKIDFNQIKDGSVHTIQASNLCNVIHSKDGSINKKTKKQFDKIFKYRNKALHLVLNDNLREVVIQQLIAWHSLYLLMTDTWQTIFNEFLESINETHKKIKSTNHYLKSRYQGQKETIDNLNSSGLIAKCLTCEFEAVKLESNKTSFSKCKCLVCENIFFSVQWSCKNWSLLEEAVEKYSCTCDNEAHLIVEIMNELNNSR